MSVERVLEQIERRFREALRAAGEAPPETLPDDMALCWVAAWIRSPWRAWSSSWKKTSITIPSCSWRNPFIPRITVSSRRSTGDLPTGRYGVGESRAELLSAGVRSRAGLQLTDDFSRLGETSRFVLGKDPLAVHGDVEDPPSSCDEFGFRLEGRFQLGR